MQTFAARHLVWTRLFELIQREATLVDKIIRGVTPPDIPVEQPTKFTRLSTLRPRRHGASPFLLARADEVIE